MFELSGFASWYRSLVDIATTKKHIDKDHYKFNNESVIIWQEYYYSGYSENEAIKAEFDYGDDNE